MMRRAQQLAGCLFAILVSACIVVTNGASAPSVPYASRSWQTRRQGGWGSTRGGPFDAHRLHAETPFIYREVSTTLSDGRRGAILLASSNEKKSRWGRRRKGKKEPEPEIDIAEPEEEEGLREPTVDEMYASMGIVGRAVVGAVDVAVVTVTSYLSGALLGYFGGGLMGVPVLFRPYSAPPPGMESGMRIIDPNHSFLKEARGRLGNWNGKALSAGKTWGELSAAFSGFHALARAARGNVEDRWNGILGSAMTGAYMSRKGGTNAMIQGAATYASFTYLIDIFFGTGGGTKRRQLPDGTVIDDQFEFKDEPVS